MSAARCEPPEHLRGVDGWHWVELFGHTEPVLELWSSANQMWLGIPCDPDYAHDAGYRYLSPVAPPAVVRGLVEALEGLLVGCEYRPGGYSFAFGDDVPAGWGTKTIPTDAALDAARSALAAAKEAGP